MKFRIVGAEKQTARNVDIVVVAASVEEAQQQAQQMGVLVERIKQVVDRPAPLAGGWLVRPNAQFGNGIMVLGLLLFGFLIFAVAARYQAGTDRNHAFQAVQQTTTSPSRTDPDACRQVGYLKDGARNRIYTIAYQPGTSKHAIESYAESLMHTPGQMTAAYFYPEGSVIPDDGVTLAGSVFKANDVLYKAPGLSKWRYAYMRHFKGTSVFVDCEQDPGNDLCRPK